MKKSRIKKGLIVGVVLFFLFLILYYLWNSFCIYWDFNQMCTNERTSDEVLTHWLTAEKGFDMEAFRKEYRIEEVEIEGSGDGHKIPASYIYAKGNKDKGGDTVIMVHGLLGSRLSNYPVSQMFLKLGYNVITYDQRSSGGNQAEHTTFGFLESQDTLDYVSYALNQENPDSKLGVWGQSMGAATVENAMDDPLFMEQVDFVVLDCPLGNMEDALVNGDGSSFTSQVKLALASLVTKQKLGFYFKEQRVFPQIAKADIPVLVASSKADRSCPYVISESVYKAVRCKQKKMFTVQDSAHSDIYFDHPEEYGQAVEDFLAGL